MKTKGNFRFSAAHSNLTTLQTNTNAAQAVRSITLAQQLKRSSAAPTNHNNIDEHIRVIKSLSPSSFTLDNLYDELAVMAIIRALSQSFDDVVRTISILDKFD